MAVETNGKLVESKGANGISNGHVSDHIPRKRAATKAKSFGLFSIVARLFTWYALLTILVRCPSTVDQLTDSSPKICRPYFTLRSFATPHLEPYYNTYAASYVDAVRPYYDTLDKKVIIPAAAFGKKYGAPRVAQAQAFGQAQWEKTMQPQVIRLQGIANEQYNENLAHHVDAITKATGPYFEIAKTNAFQTYYGHILPTYNTIQPYAIQGYDLLSAFTVNTALPYSKWAWKTGTVFLDRTVWPRLRILYGENVEPQLVRIGERLGRYRDGKKLKASIEEIDINSSASSASETLSSIISSISSAHVTTTTSSAEPSSSVAESPVAPQSTKLSEKEIRENAAGIVANDLKTWQEKFAKAADEGSDELEARINDITDKSIHTQVEGVGRALIIELEETAASSFKTLKSKIQSIVKNAKEGDDSEDALNLAVRKAGAAIKGKAQAVRTWRKNNDDEINSLIGRAAEDTFDIIDHIRDLGLQEIGMRWAWTDGITHKDWAKYHQLKTKFDEWRVDVEKVATEHPGLLKARAASEDVENQAMAIAGDAAKELSRLKETGRWKLSAGDASDDFSTKYMPAAAAVAGQKVLNKVSDASEAIVGTPQGTLESVTSAASSFVASQVENVQNAGHSVTKSAESIASSLSSEIIGTPQGSVESVLSVAGESASSVAEQASSAIIGTSQGTIESIASVGSASASSLSAKASSAILGEEPGVLEKASSSIKSVASAQSDSASSFSDAISSSISSATSAIDSVSSLVASSLSESATDSSSSISSAASSASSTASKKVWGGAMAEHVEARKIIFEDVIDDSGDETFSERLQSMASEAGDRYSDITKAVSEALFKTTGTEKFPMTKVAASQYSSALSAASVALFGTEQGTGESVSSLVSSRFAEAVVAASSIIYGTPIPVTNSIASQATAAYQSALSLASDKYAAAMSLASVQISGTPTPVQEALLSSVETAFSDSVAAANSRLQEALSAGSAVIYGTPTPALQAAFFSASAIASSRLSEGLRIASERLEDGKIYVQAANIQGPKSQELIHQMKVQFYAGVGMAHDQYTQFLEVASSAVMPKQTPTGVFFATPTNEFEKSIATASMYLGNAVSTASSQLNAALSSLSSYAAQTNAPATQNLAAAASSQFSEAVSLASVSFQSVQSVISEKYASATSGISNAVVGSEKPWTESAASAASENWEALVTKASSQVYGVQTPHYITRKLISEIKDYAAQATAAAQLQYSVVQSIVGELVAGKEPDFTESVYRRLRSVYPTQPLASASSYASEAYESASSVVASLFTPPPALESILSDAASRVNNAVEAASVQLYGSQKNAYEKATDAAASAYSSVQSVASEQIYGTTAGYAEAAQSSISAAASSAQKAISEAIYGTPTGTIESATSLVAGTFSTGSAIVVDNLSSASSLASAQYSSARAGISNIVYPPEQGAIDSAQARLSAAVESARAKLAEFAAAAGEGASEAVRKASEGVEEFASTVSSAVDSARSHIKDEL